MMATLKFETINNDLCRNTVDKYKNKAFMRVTYKAGTCKATNGTKNRGYPGPFHKLICGIGGE